MRRLLDSPWLYLSLAGCLAIAALLSTVEIHLPSRPVGSVSDLRELGSREDLNVVFILIDTLRADHLSAYGYPRETSPIIDFLASSGVRFDRVHAQSSWTKSSMASLWSASYPSRVDVLRYTDALAPELELPAEILSANGFVTGGIFRNGWVAANFGFNQGFHVYAGAKPSVTPERLQRHNPSAHALTGSDWDVTDGALEFLRSYGHQRFFLYLHFMDVHQYTYDQDSARFGNELPDAYDNAILWTDRNVSILMRSLEDLDLLSKTLVVIASDHGEAFWEHGLEGHGRNLYREVTRTPLIFVLPFRLDPGIVVETPVENVDIWPTLLDLLGLPAMPGTDGRSLVPLIEAAASPGGTAESDGPRFAELDRSWGTRNRVSETLVSVERGDHRMIDNLQRPEAVELYDTSVDPTEQENLAADRPELVSDLREEIERLTSAEKIVDAPQVEIDEMRRAQLNALGYVVK